MNIFNGSGPWRVALGVAALAAGLASAPVYAQNEVTITLGTTNKETGIALKEPDGAATSVVTKGGSSARSTLPPSGKTGGTMEFDVDNAFSTEGSSPDLYLTVEYFDEGTDQFKIEYDAVGETPETDMLKSTETLAKYDTKKWLTYTFHLPDAFFGNRQPGEADFRINDLTLDIDGNPVDGEAAETIRKVSISKVEPIPLHIKFTDAPVKLDGILDDPAWASAQVFQVNSASQDVIRPSKWEGLDDYSVDAKFAWDNDYLYLSYDVTDDVPRANNDDPGTAWNGDGAEVYFGFDQSKPSRTAYIVGQDFQIDMSAGPNPTFGVFSSGGLVWSADEESPFQPQDNIKVVDTPKGYILEARIPWAMLNDENGEPHKAPVPGQRVGFNVFANDGDDPAAPAQEVAMGFTGRPGAWGNPSAWATVVMDPAAPAVTLGDLNGDNKINVQDATVSLRIAVGAVTATDAQKEAGDVNKDGKWNVQDTTLILRRAVGAISAFP